MEGILPLRGAPGARGRRAARAQRGWVRAATPRLPERTQPVLQGDIAGWSTAGLAEQCTFIPVLDYE